MNARERVLATLNHKEPDKVPIDLGGTQVTTLTRQAYHSLRTYLNLDPEPNPTLCDRIMDVIYPSEEILNRFEVDFRPIQLRGPDYFVPRNFEDGFYDEYGVRWKRASFYFDAIERPLIHAQNISDIEQLPLPDPADPGRIRGLKNYARELFETTEYALVADIMCLGPFEGALTLRGYEQFCVDLHQDPRFAQYLLERLTDLAIGFWDVFLGEVGGYVQVAAQGDDIGMQTGPWLSPDMFRKFIKPCLKRIYDFIHSKSNAKIFMHSCGSVFDILPDLVETGIDILNPLQRSAAKMDIEKIKKDYGNVLCFWGGGIDIQKVLPFASLEQIEAEVRYAIDTLAPSGGYVFAATHNIQPDVSPDRIEKLYDSALNYRDYSFIAYG